MPEFTGERVIPGQIDLDLWNEHFARYLFASRLSAHKRVLDIATGTGYGANLLASAATEVIGIDVSAEAISHASGNYAAANLTFQTADALALPFPDRSFDLVLAFEVIEHLHDWRELLTEARRVLHPAGQFLVSTPNRDYYTESRAQAGPNPFHIHEFDYDEFLTALRAAFPSVSIFVQNHTQALLFQPLHGKSAVDVRCDSARTDPHSAHFFLAVCALAPQMGAPTFVYVPSAANILRERELHIARLNRELHQKDAWLAQSQHEHAQLVGRHRQQTAELEARNHWAAGLNHQLAAAFDRIASLQNELAAEQAAARDTVAAYDGKIAALEADVAEKVAWVRDTEARLQAELADKSKQLLECIDLLHKAEATIDERTRWAQRLDERRRQLEAALSAVQASRWHRVGRSIGLGPELTGA